MKEYSSNREGKNVLDLDYVDDLNVLDEMSAKKMLQVLTIQDAKMGLFSSLGLV